MRTVLCLTALLFLTTSCTKTIHEARWLSPKPVAEPVGDAPGLR
jgi:hypothetical protein